MDAIQAVGITMMFFTLPSFRKQIFLKKLMYDQNHKKAQTCRRGEEKAKNHPRNHFDFGGGLPTTS